MKTIAAIFLSTVFASGFLGCARTEVAANSNQYDVEAAGSYPSLGEIVTSSGDRICSATYFGHWFSCDESSQDEHNIGFGYFGRFETSP